MQSLPSETVPLQTLHSDTIEQKRLQVRMLRLDQNHPFIQGNKWYKLRYNLRQAEQEGQQQLLTFGGAYSNHIVATAAAGYLFGFGTTGVIRGTEFKTRNAVLQFAANCNMNLHFISRAEYRQRHDPLFIAGLKNDFGSFYLLPEGGTNALAVKGCEAIAELIPKDTDYVCLSCGTGGTMAGIINGVASQTFVLGFASLKGGAFLKHDIRQWLDVRKAKDKSWDVNTDYHFGGFAKSNAALKALIHDFELQYQIPLEYVYTGKMLYGFFDLILQGYFPEGSNIVIVHTGGILAL